MNVEKKKQEAATPISSKVNTSEPKQEQTEDLGQSMRYSHAFAHHKVHIETCFKLLEFAMGAKSTASNKLF